MLEFFELENPDLKPVWVEEYVFYLNDAYRTLFQQLLVRFVLNVFGNCISIQHFLLVALFLTKSV